jgi:hypothetical protein
MAYFGLIAQERNLKSVLIRLRVKLVPPLKLLTGSAALGFMPVDFYIFNPDVTNFVINRNFRGK